MEINKIHKGDCLELMKQIEDNSVDMILCDLPYGKTACKWDIIIDLKLLWKEYKRITKPNSIIILTASQPFTTDLINSNRRWFKYELIWEKEQGTNQNLCQIMPLKNHENILIFQNQDFTTFSNYLKEKRKVKKISKSEIDNLLELNTSYSWWEGRKGGIQLPSERNYIKLKKVLDLDNRFDELILKRRYFPQMEKGNPYYIKRNNKIEFDPIIGGSQRKKDTINLGLRFPKSIIKFNRNLNKRFHPTEKPVLLFNYLIKTFTVKGDLVLDNCIGSGTTAIACKKTNRNFIGIEKEQKYVDIANKRLQQEILVSLN